MSEPIGIEATLAHLTKQLGNEGGPAFPSKFHATFESSPIYYRGMTLRDFFAAQALTGLTLRPAADTYRQSAMIAYKYADEMLRERLHEAQKETETSFL